MTATGSLAATCPAGAQGEDSLTALAARHVFEKALCGQRLLVLGDLVTLGQIRVKVVFAGKNRIFVHRALQRQRRRRGKLDGAVVQNGQGAREPQANRADVTVGRGAESRAATAENFGPGEQPGVNFEPNNRFKGHGV